jgi:D-3-phosphoglycerate dehydrogenase
MNLLKVSDFITIHLPKTKETANLIGVEALKKVKPTVRIINAARGGVLDEAALFDAINEGRVAGAGLDVFCNRAMHRFTTIYFGSSGCNTSLRCIN